jgi:hypothetical protein
MAANRLVLLVGSGVSRASDAPTLDKLTTQILESPWRPHTDWRFYPVPSGEELTSEGLAAKCQQFIRIIDDDIKAHLFTRDGRAPNYEDYFACLKQIV